MGKTLYRASEYERQRGDWITLRDMYEGYHDVVNGPDYLWSHYCEKDGTDPVAQQLRSARFQRTRYLNLPDIITSLMVSLLLRKKPNYEKGAEKLLTDLGATKNVDGKNTGLPKFIKKTLEQYIIYGKSVVIAESFQTNARSLGDEQKVGARPFLDILNPLDVVDWDYETLDPRRIGRLNMLRYEYRYCEPRGRSTKEAFEHIRSKELVREAGGYSIYTYQAQAKKNGEQLVPWGSSVDTKGLSWDLVSESTTDTLTEIPVSIIEDASWIYDVVQETMRCHNLRSNKDNIQYNQGYRKHFGKGIKLDPTMTRTAMNEYNIVDIGTQGEVITVEPVTVVEYEAAIANSIDYAFKLGLNMLRMLPSDSKLTQSEDTIAEEKDNIYALVETTLTDFESFTGKYLTDFGVLAGRELKDPITFDKKLSEKSISTFISVYGSFRDQFAKYPETEKMITKQAIARLGLTDEELAEAKKEIDETETPKPEDAASERASIISGALGGGQRGAKDSAKSGDSSAG